MKVIVIAGPTASGKTAVGVELAKKLNGEIISCDSMQIYKDIPICSAQPTKEEMQGIPHHLMGFLELSARFTAYDYSILAREKIREIISLGKQPIIVGGTSLYFHFLIYEPDFMPESTACVRKSFDGIPTEELFARLFALNSQTAIKPADRKRITRALEIYELTGTLPKDNFDEKRLNTEFEFELFCVSPPRSELYERINKRVDLMLEAGLENEILAALKKGVSDEHQCFKAIGFRQLAEFFNGEISKDEAIEKIKQESRRYAKRQLTWMRKENATWLDKTKEENLSVILERLGIVQ